MPTVFTAARLRIRQGRCCGLGKIYTEEVIPHAAETDYRESIAADG
jgi:hypothetical protein